MNKRSVFIGAGILTIGTFLSKILGGIYRLVLTGILGSEGIGRYQLVFPVFSLMLVVSTAGIPLAVSKMIAKCNAENDTECKKRILKNSITILGIISLLLALVLCFLSEKIAIVQGDASLSKLYLILAPSLVFVSITAVLRGYFQGENQFAPTAINQIIEQFAKVIIGLVACLILIKKSLFLSLVGAVAAITISEIVAFLFMMFYSLKHKGSKIKEKNKIDKQIIKSIFNAALPITLTSILLPLASFVDSLIVVNLLKSNFSLAVSTKLYGIETGVVSSITNMPNMFSFALASALLPIITINFFQNDTQSTKNILTICSKINLIIAIPCAFACILFSPDIINLLYAGKFDTQTFEGTKIAASLLSIGGISILYFGFLQIYSVALHAMNRRYITVLNMFIGVAAKFVIEILLLPDKNFGIYALTISNVACYGIAMLLNFIYLKSQIEYFVPFLDILKILFSSAVMLGVIAVLKSYLSFKFGFAVAVMIGGMFYVFILLMFKIFKKCELKLMFSKQK